MKPLAGQVALVTGASRGIGAAAAVELARRGAHVVAIARTQGGLEATDDAIRAEGGTATLLPLDLLEFDSIDQIGPSLHARFGRLDIVVGNAATLVKLTPVSHILNADWAQAVGVNVTAGWRLIRTTTPLLAIAPAGRAVFVTSRIVAKPAAYWGLYGASKAAMEHLVLSWAEEHRSTNLRINLFDPGIVATRLRAQAMPGEDPKTLASAASVAPALVDLCDPRETRHGQIVQVTRSPIKVVESLA